MLSMSEASSLSGGVGMLAPFDSLYEQPKPRFIFKMPRVVPDQKHKFETDELFRRLSRESEVRYTGYRDRPQEERQVRFQNGCREGHTEIAFVATGTNIQLMFNNSSNGYHHHHHHHHHSQHLSNSSINNNGRETDFEKEHGKVHLRSHFIMNGVCVCWRGWVDLERLDGVGCLEFDEERAAVEDALLRDQIERYNQRLREFEERQRSYRGGAMSAHPERGGTGGSGNGSAGAGSGGSHGQPLEQLTPLIFCFELPNVGTLQNFPDLNSEFITSIQDTYNVQVMCRTRAKLYPTMVIVKGCEWEVKRVKEATQLLINHMCQSFANQSTVQMMMEISPQYHSLVLGAQQQNLKTIMHLTGAQVMFPDPSDPYTPSLKRSSVIISGPINKVYLARQMLIGSLPLVLMFDFVPESTSINTGLLEELMNSHDVYISIKPKPKQSVYSVIIKGLERNARNMYEARRLLMGCGEKIKTEVPPTYHTPGPVPTFLKSFSAVGNNFHNFQNLQNPLLNNRPAPLSLSMWLKPLMQHVSNDLPSCNNFHAQLNSPTRTPVNQTPHHTPLQQKYNGWSVSDMLQSLGSLGQKKFPPYPDMRDSPSYSSCISSDTSSLSASPRTASPISSLTESTSNSKLDLNELSERKAPGFERSIGNSIVVDAYQQLRIQATQAMQGMPNPAEVRVPTQTWSGYGFSHSSPSPIVQSRVANREEPTNTNEEGGVNRSLFNDSVESNNRLAASNYLDAAASSTFNVVTSSNYSDLPSQLASLGLQKYIQLFKSHEIDLSTFQTLTDADLREIGVTAFGARKKMMLFISELKKRDQINVFRGSAAPGAERKSSPSSSPQNDNSW